MIIVYASGWQLWQTRPMDWTAKTFGAERGVGPHHLCKRGDSEPGPGVLGVNTVMVSETQP